MPFTPSLPRIAYSEHGHGPPLVFVNGMGGVQAGWLMSMRELSRDFRTIAYDHRGAGGSQVVDADTRMRDFAADLVRLLDHLRIPTASFVGLSFGGRVLMELALHWPERVERLVMGGTSCGGSQHLHGDHEALEAMLNASTLDEQRWLEKVIPAMFGARFREAYPERMRNLARWWARHPPDPAGLARQHQAYAHFDVCGRLHEIRCPALILHGTEDGLSPVENGRRLAAGLPNAHFVAMDGVGHSPNAEEPEAFYALVRAFMRGGLSAIRDDDAQPRG